MGVIGGGAPYTTNGWWVGLEKSRQRAAYFLRAEKVGKDALRGVRARWVPRLRSAAAVTHRPRLLRTPITGDSTWALALAAGARSLTAAPLLRRPLRPDPADKSPPALVLRRLSAGADGVGRCRGTAGRADDILPCEGRQGQAPCPTCCEFAGACQASGPPRAGEGAGPYGKSGNVPA